MSEKDADAEVEVLTLEDLYGLGQRFRDGLIDLAKQLSSDDLAATAALVGCALDDLGMLLEPPAKTPATQDVIGAIADNFTRARAEVAGA